MPGSNPTHDRPLKPGELEPPPPQVEPPINPEQPIEPVPVEPEEEP